MKYYVLSIQCNKETKNENRSAPKSFNSRNDAIKEFYRQLSSDMGNAMIGWSICMLINSAMGVEMSEKYIADDYTEDVVSD